MIFNILGDLVSDDGYRLPTPSPCGICYWGGSPDTSDAQRTIDISQNSAIDAANRYYLEARSQVAPWRDTGIGALGQLSGLLGVPGYTAIDPTATLTSTPGYKFLQDQGTQALARYGAATGLSLSGPAAKSAQNYGQNLAQTYAWGPYMSALQNLSGQGLSAGTSTGGWALGTGTNEANTYLKSGQEMAQLQMQQEAIKAQEQNSMWSDIMGGLGFAGSLALAPFTGGGSLIGAGIGALGNVFGGGGMSVPQMYNAGYGSYNAYSALPGGGYRLMANGGPTDANQPYIIGERGPELFIPNVPGYIIPNEFMKYSSFGDEYSNRRAA